eukprot:10093439-Lingulodinium_polyedra.AAC.1
MMKTKWQKQLEEDQRYGLRTANPGSMLGDPAVVAWAAVAGPRPPRPDRSKSRGRNGKNKDGVVGHNGG